MIHLYRGNDHRICKICGHELPIELLVKIGRILVCRDCAKELKKAKE